MSKKILLADDSVTIQKVISITFSSEDYELTVVGDGDAAINKAKEEHPDLVLADVAMPGKNGYEVSEALKKDPATANIPVMLLAGTFEPLDKHEAERVKADESIVKPFESQELLDKVRTLLAKAATAPSGGASAKAGARGAEEIWEPGDFTGFTEEPEFKEQEAPDLSFLEEGLSETADLSGPGDAFTDLEFHEEDFKGQKESAAAPPPPPAPEPEKKPEAYEPPVGEEFDIVEPFEFKTGEAKADTFDIPSFKEEPAAGAPEAGKSKKPFWAETEREDEAVKASEPAAEPDLIEAPQEAGDVVEFVDVIEEKTPLKEAPRAAR
ncbi:MAG TPA: response regulator, partial [Thermodesulfobacteriota bacterium]|nr:response regulator [Thermodesulfobacteriota bacterium]